MMICDKSVNLTMLSSVICDVLLGHALIVACDLVPWLCTANHWNNRIPMYLSSVGTRVLWSEASSVLR